MRAVIQRVKKATVIVDGEPVGEIGEGVLVFLAVGKDDTHEQADFLLEKIVNLRIFEDRDGKMNHSAKDQSKGLLIVSQFTLLGDCRKGRRPSFDDAAEPKRAEELYNYFIESAKKENIPVSTGRFRAMMDVELVNDGPVTFILDSP